MPEKAEIYSMYLRKSRADAEAEAHGEGETLKRHETMLLELANKRNLQIGKIYREIVSADSISMRPMMQELLKDVSDGMWTGVLVVDIERLARGDTMDQGTLASTFKYSHTKIITPSKVYDPTNEFDEEYFEFGLFMARREYKTITRRMQRGREASIKEGKYASNRLPYGYSKMKLKGEKGWILVPREAEANIVKQIFEWYTSGAVNESGFLERIGTSKIARRLNNMGVPTQNGGPWVPVTIRDMLRNPVYIAKLTWNSATTIKKVVNGKTVGIRVPSPEKMILADGRHQPIIDEALFLSAQEMMDSNRPRPIGEHLTIKSPLAGLVVCSCCGRTMVRRPLSKGKDLLMCPLPNCETVSCPLEDVENAILYFLRSWVSGYELDMNSIKKQEYGVQLRTLSGVLSGIDQTIDTLKMQIRNAHSLLERGIYDADTFLERSKILAESMAEANRNRASAQQEIEQVSKLISANDTSVPQVKRILEVYQLLQRADAKNNLLKEVIDRVEYTKTEKGKRGRPSPPFMIQIYPKIPAKQADD